MNNEIPLLQHDLETLLELGEPIFKSIDLLVSQSKFDEAYIIIENTPPLKEWLVEYPSLIKDEEKYKTIHLQLLRKVMNRIFGAFRIDIYKPQIFESSTGKFSSTSNVTLFYPIRRLGVTPLVSHGVATDTCDSIELLRLCTPSSVSLAEKDAIMRIGDLFGRSLNGRGVGKVEDKKEMPLPVPDKDIIKQWLKAVEDGDMTKQGLYLSVYDNQKLHDALKK